MIATPPPPHVQAAQNNIVCAIQSRIVALRREADALERDLQTIILANNPPAPPATPSEARQAIDAARRERTNGA